MGVENANYTQCDDGGGFDETVNIYTSLVTLNFHASAKQMACSTLS